MIQQKSVTKQQSLGFVHKTAETSKIAARQARPQQHRKQLAALNSLLLAGYHGRTRYELADATDIPRQSICSVARGLIESGQVVESGRRLTEYGSPAAVLKLRRFAEQPSRSA